MEIATLIGKNLKITKKKQKAHCGPFYSKVSDLWVIVDFIFHSNACLGVHNQLNNSQG